MTHALPRQPYIEQLRGAACRCSNWSAGMTWSSAEAKRAACSVLPMWCLKELNLWTEIRLQCLHRDFHHVPTQLSGLLWLILRRRKQDFLFLVVPLISEASPLQQPFPLYRIFPRRKSSTAALIEQGGFYTLVAVSLKWGNCTKSWNSAWNLMNLSKYSLHADI